ncbi:MAG: LysR family transcriptional regulator [Bacteroidales bacterium]
MISAANHIELRHFQYFRVLAEELHYRKASEKLHITQSALSQQIKQLENLLGVFLLDRINKKVVLTDAGHVFYADSVRVLNKIDSAINNLELFKEGKEGQIKIAFVASAMDSILPELFSRFHDEHPDVRLYLSEMTNKEQLETIRSGGADIGFVRTNQVGHDMIFKSVLKETLTLILPADHHLNKDNFTDVGQVKDERYILLPNDYSPSYFQQILSLCADQNFQPRISHISTHVPTIFKLVENKMGLSIIPTSSATGNNPNIRFIELDNIPQRTELFAVWNKHSGNPALPYLLKLLH